MGGEINMPSRKAVIMVVDDDVRILQLIRRILEAENYGVLSSSNGQDALAMFNRRMPDLVLLDIMMPGMDGYAVCNKIREVSNVPIIMITAKDQNRDVVEGFDLGADDYITKPFSPKELIARIKAVMRRTKKKNKPTEPYFENDDLRIDFTRLRVSVKGRDVNLSSTEYKLISFLARNAGRLVPAEQILTKVWGKEHIKKTHLLQVNVARLRSKLKDSPKNPRYILTKSGMGYMVKSSKPTVTIP